MSQHVIASYVTTITVAILTSWEITRWLYAIHIATHSTKYHNASLAFSWLQYPY